MDYSRPQGVKRVGASSADMKTMRTRDMDIKLTGSIEQSDYVTLVILQDSYTRPLSDRDFSQTLRRRRIVPLKI